MTTSRNFETHSLFPILFLTVFGWIQLHAWGIRHDVQLILHVMFVLPSLALSSIAFSRYRKHLPAPAFPRSDSNGKRRKPAGNRNTTALLLLSPAGFVIALIAETGPLIGLVLTASLLICIPWARLPVCRENFIASLISAETGAVTGMLVVGDYGDPFSCLWAAWVCLVVSTIALTSVVVVHGNRSDKMFFLDRCGATLQQETSAVLATKNAADSTLP